VLQGRLTRLRLGWTRFRQRLTRPRLRRKARAPAASASPGEPTRTGAPPPPRRRLPRPRVPRPRIPRPRISRRSALFGLAALLVAGAAAALIATDPFDGGDDEAPAPRVAGAEKVEVQVEAVEAAASLGFPAFATNNTTRVGGSDPEANAAGVALAVYPSAGGSTPPPAVTIVAEDDWQGAIAASVLAADPIHAPILIGSSDGVPSATDDAITAMAPKGSPETGGAAAFAIGPVDAPEGIETTDARGADPATRAAAIDRLRGRLLQRQPDHVVIASEEEPAFAMPAAAWAARSGDPVLFTRSGELPKPTAKALKRHKGVPVYLLGPSSVISSDVVRQIGRVTVQPKRVSGEDPISNAVEFARYADGSFGWNINDPGHGFVVARSDRPADAAAASSLSASGTWGPLLLTDSASELPGALRGYLLDVKPGYRTDPTRALYNHVWVIGDQEAIDVNQQAAIDELAELARIGAAPEPKQRPQKPRGKRGKP
jgi:hypothetical protein